jgi:molybdopterin-binding protein
MRAKRLTVGLVKQDRDDAQLLGIACRGPLKRYILAHVTVRVAGGVIESVITRRSAEDMGLKNEDVVSAVVKATEVMIAKA